MVCSRFHVSTFEVERVVTGGCLPPSPCSVSVLSSVGVKSGAVEMVNVGEETVVTGGLKLDVLQDGRRNVDVDRGARQW